MADILEKFQKEVIGSKGKVFDYISRINSSGDFDRLSGISAIINHWRNILLTPIGSYDHDPTFGSELYKYVFEQVDAKTASMIKNEILYRLTSYDNRATISNVSIGLLPNRKGFSINLEVKFGDEIGDLDLDLDQDLFLDFMERSD